MMNSRRRHAYLGSNLANSEMDINSWKQNAAQSQVEKKHPEKNSMEKMSFLV